MPSRKSDARRSTAPTADDDSEMTTSQQDTPVPPAEQLAAATISSETPAPESNAATSEKGKEKSKERDNDAITIEDLNLPKSIITRLAKGVLPPNTQIQANAILALSQSATVFVNHLSNAANELTQLSGKKTIMPADVFKALDDIEYGFMRERLEAEFAKFNEVQSTKRSAYRKKVSAAKKAQQAGSSSGAAGADESMMSTGTGMGGDESFMANTTVGTETGDAGAGRAAKKAKVDSSSAGGRMEVDGEERGDGEVSDAETVPDEPVEEDDDDEDDDEEEEESDEEGDDDERGPGGEDDELEDRPRGMEDEALDDDSE